MTQVRIHDYEPISGRRARPCQDRARETECGRVALDQLDRARPAVRANAFTRAVRRTVVDKYDLVRDRRSLRDPVQERRNVFGLIQRRYDQRDHGGVELERMSSRTTLCGFSLTPR